MVSPSIVLSSQFVVSSISNKSFSNYIDYMDRVEALELRGFGADTYLGSKNRDKLSAIKNGLAKMQIKKIKYQTPINPLDSTLTKKAKKYLNEINLADFDENEFNKFITKDTARHLNGVFSIDNDDIQIGKDTKHVREMLSIGEKHGSVMWQDVISFDTQFLVRHRLLDPQTDTLNTKAMIAASHKMMETFTNLEKLNNPYWVAAIHRNTGNIHIHFATVEEVNSRKIKEIKGKQQPRGKRKQSTIDKMKASFTNELLDMSDLLKDINTKRNKLRKEVINAFKELPQDNNLQSEITNLLLDLPTNKKKWHYASLHKSQKERINKITNQLLSNNDDYQELQLDIATYSNNREDIYGKTKRNSKNYKENKLSDIQKRLGNALLHELMNQTKTQEKRKKAVKSQLNTGNLKNNWNSTVRTIHRLTSTQFQEKQEKKKKKFLKKLSQQKADRQFKEKLKFTISKDYLTELQRRMNIAFDKENTNYDKRQKLMQFQQMIQGGQEFE